MVSARRNYVILILATACASTSEGITYDQNQECMGKSLLNLTLESPEVLDNKMRQSRYMLPNMYSKVQIQFETRFMWNYKLWQKPSELYEVCLYKHFNRGASEMCLSISYVVRSYYAEKHLNITLKKNRKEYIIHFESIKGKEVLFDLDVKESYVRVFHGEKKLSEEHLTFERDFNRLEMKFAQDRVNRFSSKACVTRAEAPQDEEGEQYQCGVRYKAKMRIHGGKVAPRGFHPWIVRVEKRNNKGLSICGGVLLPGKEKSSTQVVLTAAHCIWEAEDVTVYIGVHLNSYLKDKNMIKRRVVLAFTHPKFIYNEKFANHDIAILKLEKPVKFSEHVRPICLPDEYGYNAFMKHHETICLAAGWGVVAENEDPTYLKHIPLRVMKGNVRYGGVLLADNPNKNGSTCMGDSGGPLECTSDGKVYLLGISSFIEYPVDSKPKCNTGGYMGFADVEYFVPWIRQNMPHFI